MSKLLIETVIIDDDEDAINLIKNFIRKHPAIHICGFAKNFDEGLDLIIQKKPQLALLDINMPGKDGIELADKIDLHLGTSFIFISGEYHRGVDAINVQPFDFLTKPFTPEQLIESIDRFVEHYRRHNFVSSDKELDQLVLFKTENGRIYVNLADLLYIEGNGNYSKIHFCGDEQEAVSKTLKAIQEKLPEKYFFRIFKSFIVNLKFIKSFDKITKKIVLNNQGNLIEFSVSPLLVKELQIHIEKYKFL